RRATITACMQNAYAVSSRDLEVVRIGSGPPVVLVHGSVVGANRTWRRQRPLAERWTLIMPNRPGFGGSPPLPRGDFEAEAPRIAELLGDGAHLIGHSYGAVLALLAAAARPDAVRSLAVSVAARRGRPPRGRRGHRSRRGALPPARLAVA